MTIEFWITMVVYGLTAGITIGTVLTKIKALETKQDIHNGLITKMTTAETEIVNIKEDIKEDKESHLRIENNLQSFRDDFNKNIQDAYERETFAKDRLL